MIGTPSEIEVHVSRKLSDGDYGSFEVSASLRVNLPPDANLEEAFDSADSWLTAAVAGSVREKRAGIAKQKPELPKSASDGDGLTPPEAEKPVAKEGDSRTAKIVKFSLKKRPDKKFELELYPEIKGAPGKYPEVRFVADRDRMWDMLAPVAEGYDFSDLPVEYECAMTANYLIGKETPKGGHYKDLVSVKGA